MCGICGFIHYKRITQKTLQEMNQTLKYRGPDDDGYMLQDIEANNMQIGLAHNRLSILDLSLLGHQPMKSYDNRVAVCFNGEIYNYLNLRNTLQKKGYIFKSNSDTEVIINAYLEWGISCVNKFNGMFAIALWDKVNSMFYLVRDRIGIKPLYYYYDGQNLVFASELKPIMKYPFFKKDINIQALSEYLHYQYITGPKTIFKNTYKLEPGCILTFSNSKIEISSYWSIEKAFTNNNPFAGNYQDTKNKLKELLLDAVKFRMIADVPLGGFLSGGYDSTLIISLMRELSTNTVKTFTIGFHETQYDEAQYAEQIAKHLGTEHYYKYLSLDEAKTYIKNIPLYFDEPMADPSQIATMLLARETRQHVTVALSGDAGDELFCGYNKYCRAYNLLKYRHLSKIIKCIDHFIDLKTYLKNTSRKFLKLYYCSCPKEIINADFYVFWDRYNSLLPSATHSEKYVKMTNYTDDIRENYMLTDMITYLPDDILTKVDRATMAFSLESRVPFLDYRVVEFALSLPIEYKYKDGNQKRILKDIAYDYVDKDLLDRPKQGFGVPIYEWLQTDFKGMTQNYFEENFLKRQGIFNPYKINEMVNEFKNRHNPEIARNIWTILVFQMWWEQYLH